DGRAADDDARAVVYEEGGADARAGMYVYARAAVRVLGHDARDERDAERVQFVREAVDRYRVEAGVAEDDLVVAGGRRVALVGGSNVGRQGLAHARQSREELLGALGRLTLLDGAGVV